MSILADHQIYQLCQPHASVHGPLVDPFDEERVQPASIDLTLGNEFITFEGVKLHNDVIDLANPPRPIGNHSVIGDDEFIRLNPLEFILGVTRERINCPPNVAAKLDGKSSLARFGLLIHVTGGFVDPGFRGPLTLEIFNVFPIPIILRPGLPFCQVGFQRLYAPAARPYSGRYQDAEGVEGSKYDGR